MNGRIKELVEQSGISLYKKDVLDKHFPELYDSVYCESSVEQLEKFAELIIRECAKACDDVSKDSFGDWRGGAWECETAVLERFGLEK